MLIRGKIGVRRAPQATANNKISAIRSESLRQAGLTLESSGGKAARPEWNVGMRPEITSPPRTVDANGTNRQSKQWHEHVARRQRLRNGSGCVTPWIEPPSGSAVDRLDRRGDASLGMGGKRIS
jgi:hypothetical protein